MNVGATPVVLARVRKRLILNGFSLRQVQKSGKSAQGTEKKGIGWQRSEQSDVIRS